MNVFEAVKQNVTARQAAEMYGIHVNRNGMAACPFHNDRTPSMKIDRRFHCFGCQADGDAVDFVSKLFGIPCRDAAVRIADDFGLGYDRYSRPPIKPKARSPTKEELYQYEETHFLKVLSEYFRLLREWKTQYAPNSPEEEWHPLFVEALQRTDCIEYMLDVLLYGTKDERKTLTASHRNEVMKLERRVSEQSSGHAEQRGRSTILSGAGPEGEDL